MNENFLDHILALQQSLAHYERLLSQSHPTYLTQLRFSVSSARSGSDKAVVQLTTISLGVLLVQTLIGESLFHMHDPFVLFLFFLSFFFLSYFWLIYSFMAYTPALSSIGLFSMNVMIPTNPHFPYGKYNVFGAVLAGAVSIVCVYAIVVWWWWEQARRRRGRLVKA